MGRADSGGRDQGTTPAEAAAWVRYANRVRHYGVRDWEIGEEVYGNGAITAIPAFEPDERPASQHTAQARPCPRCWRTARRRSTHAAVRPDGSLVILVVNTDPARAKSVRLLVAGYRAAAAIAVRSYEAASHGIGRSRAAAGGVVSLAPSSLTELVLRPAGAR